jgi:hypothetical protein
MPSSLVSGDGVRTNAMRFAPTGPAAHARVHDERARDCKPSRATGFCVTSPPHMANPADFVTA